MNHYSQNDEQEFILNFFGNHVGSLLDIGAYDGVTFSNSRALIEGNWDAVLVEPDPRNFQKLMQNCEAFLPRGERIKLLPAAMDKYGAGFSKLTMDNYEGRGWASTIDVRCRGRMMTFGSNQIFVPRMRPDDLDCFGPFDFISIDAEGQDFDILKAVTPNTLSQCKLLCIEPHDAEEREHMRSWLLNAGFKTAHETPENLLVSNINPPPL